jgi:hypothetical protein
MAVASSTGLFLRNEGLVSQDGYFPWRLLLVDYAELTSAFYGIKFSVAHAIHGGFSFIYIALRSSSPGIF